MNLSELRSKIEFVKKLKYSKHSIKNYQYFRDKILEIYLGHRSSLISGYKPETFTIFRARKSSLPNQEIYTNLEDLWYPPLNKIKPGRLNFPKSSIFYCSADLNTALIEINPGINDLITSIELAINHTELKCIQLVYEKISENDWTNMDPLKKEVFKFIIDELRKTVDIYQFQQYYSTQIFSSLYLHNNLVFDAFAYNSVATNHMGYNFAIKPNFIDNNHIFKSARVFKVIEYRNRNNFKVKCLLEAINFSGNGRINFTEVVDCPGHDINLGIYPHK